jgi:hypothetical protein
MSSHSARAAASLQWAPPQEGVASEPQTLETVARRRPLAWRMVARPRARGVKSPGRQRSRRLLVGVLAAAVVGGGCRSETSARPSGRASGAPPASECPNGQKVAAARAARAVRADVDGDGDGDRVWLAADRRGPPGCRSFIAALLDERVVVAPVHAGPAAGSVPLGLPAIVGFAPIDDVPGDEVVVDVGAGASTLYAAVYTARAAGLAQVSIRGMGSSGPGLFPHGGSVGHVDGVGCARDGTVLMSSALARGSGYTVTRRHLLIEGATWSVAPARTRRARASPAKLISRFPELGAPPFAGCPAPTE